VVRKYHRPEKRDFARCLRRDQTDAELELWQCLRSRQLSGHKFRRQYTIGTYIADFCCPEAKLIIEIDGSQHQDQAAYDIERSNFLNSLGFRVIRFWTNEVLLHREAVLERILQTVEQPLTPTLSPGRGEGERQESPRPLGGEAARSAGEGEEDPS
jgi:very-short-patch-repair endonuclease